MMVYKSDWVVKIRFPHYKQVEVPEQLMKYSEEGCMESCSFCEGWLCVVDQNSQQKNQGRYWSECGLSKLAELNCPYNYLMADQQFNLGSSEEQILEPVNWLPRQKSNDSIFGELIGPPTYGQRPLIFPYHPHPHDQNLCPKVFKPKEKKVKSKKPCDYRKNICGYITKKIIRQYLSATYRDRVQQLCDKHGCDYNTSKTYFLGRIERITGPSHVPSLFVPGHQAEKPIKAAFKEFFIWFTKERYLRYLILEGKMQQKEAYIEYKNTVLMHLVNQSSDKPIPIQSSSSSLNEESQS